jgi:hypothetical protein
MVKLYRAYAGTVPEFLVTLSNSQGTILSRKQRWGNALLGTCFLLLGISFLFRAAGYA